jgi:transcriptional regulator with XRE-family HTH domain
MDNPLKKYLEDKNMSVHEFSCKAGLTLTTLSNVVKDINFPNRSTVCVICLFSDGELKPNDFEKYKIYKKGLNFREILQNTHQATH